MTATTPDEPVLRCTPRDALHTIRAIAGTIDPGRRASYAAVDGGRGRRRAVARADDLLAARRLLALTDDDAIDAVLAQVALSVACAMLPPRLPRRAGEAS